MRRNSSVPSVSVTAAPLISSHRDVMRMFKHKPAQPPERQPAQERPPQPTPFHFASGLAPMGPVFDFSRISIEPPLQRKATICSPSDPLEREAQEVAEKVTRERAAPAAIQQTQTKSESASRPSALDADAALRVAESPPGILLPHETHSYFEPRFGHDFSRVRVHAGPEAAAAASSFRPALTPSVATSCTPLALMLPPHSKATG
jgi:hypothetical protein